MHDLCQACRDHFADLDPQPSRHPRGQAASPVDPVLRRHMETCPHCRTQQTVHQVLARSLTGLAVPQPRKEEEVLRRISQSLHPSGSARTPQPRKPALSWGRRAVLAAYWLAAAAVSLWLLASFSGQAWSWLAERKEWVAGLAVPLGALLVLALPYLRDSLGRLLLSLAAAPGRMSQ